jgi:HEAT repeat protein
MRTIYTNFIALLIIFPAAAGCEREQPFTAAELTQKTTDELIALAATERNIETGDGVIPRRIQVVRKLGARTDNRAIPVLLSVLNSPDEDVLSSGATGVTAGAQRTYGAAIESLASYGSAAAPAVPRIRELLSDYPPSLRAEDVLTALGKISKPDAIDALLSTLRSGRATGQLFTVFDALHPELCAHADEIADRLQTEAPNTRPSQRARLIEFLMKCRTQRISGYLRYLSDDEVLSQLDVAAVHGTEAILFPYILGELTAFERRSTDTFLTSATCGPRSPEGRKNMLRGKWLSLLIQLCTPETLRAVEEHKKKFGISVRCEQSDTACRARLSADSD